MVKRSIFTNFTIIGTGTISLTADNGNVQISGLTILGEQRATFGLDDTEVAPSFSGTSHDSPIVFVLDDETKGEQ